jgi:hypothetical protein
LAEIAFCQIAQQAVSDSTSGVNGILRRKSASPQWDRCGSAAQLEQYLKMGVDAGTAKTLDNLVAYADARLQ